MGCWCGYLPGAPVLLSFEFSRNLFQLTNIPDDDDGGDDDDDDCTQNIIVQTTSSLV